jgi:glycine/D-amino acid oxidase-like deaminating enzyme
MPRQIVIIGAGEVGVTVSKFLCDLRSVHHDISDIRIVLIDSSNEQEGGKSASCVSHETGYEYFREGHEATGRTCVEGAVAKRLLFPAMFHQSGVPTRFLVSQGSSRDPDLAKRISFGAFKANAEAMRTYYSGLYSHIKFAMGWSDADARLQLGHSAVEFGRELLPDEYSDVSNVIGGYRSAGGTVNMALDYAIKRAALDQAEGAGVLKRFTNTRVRQIASANSRHIVSTDCGDFVADFVVCCAAEAVPSLATMCGASGPRGTYALNAILYVELPPTSDCDMIRKLSQVNFVLQGEHGCMYACILAPTTTDKGVAAIYFPSERGSQLDLFVYPRDGHVAPGWWTNVIRSGRPDDYDARLSRILQQAYKFNPFLRCYLANGDRCEGAVRMVARTVFNPEVPDNPNGEDRRVRQMLPPFPLVRDGTIVSVSSPKWTNVELASLNVVQYILERIGGTSLPRNEEWGIGPLKLDIGAISKNLHFRQIRFPKRYVSDYVARMKFPVHLVPDTHECYQNISEHHTASR